MFIYIYILIMCVCLCTNQITFFVWSFYFRLIRLALAFSEAFFASSAKSGAPSARDRKTLPGRGDRFAPSHSEKVEWTFVKKMSCCHVVRGCRHKAPKRPRAWISIDVLQIYADLLKFGARAFERKMRTNKSNWWDIQLCFVKPSCRHQAPPHACAATYETELEHQFFEKQLPKKKKDQSQSITHRPCK